MALVEGTKYGLSSYQNSTHSSSPNKSVVFVKLTDSALKAIEEFLKIQQKTGQNATLQFLGNEGRINIPSLQGSQAFDFSLSPNTDIEGPQGSFECIKQNGQRSLESMGALPFKMRIKANDDVYAEAEKRFSAIEEGRKQQCAKEIKPNGADIGRKVKEKRMDRLPPPIRRREPSPFSNHHSKSSPNNSVGNKSSFNSGYSHSPSFNKNSSSLNPLGNPSFNNNAGSKVPNGGSSTGTLNVTKRPLKERLIHLLALKPYKKPELIARLSRDGIKDREKTLVMTIIKQISTFKDNEYNILRGLWNDVQEDWPYYSEQEKQLMKRRKPQNLTPPGSDCSVSSGVSGCSLSPRSIASTGSGHSPPSHHSNSFSSSQTGTKSMSSNRGNMSNQCNNPSSQGVKRPASSDPLLVGPDGKLLEDISAYSDVVNKKLRLSTFKRPVCSGGNSNGSLAPSNGSHSGLGVNLNPSTRSEKDGLSPHFQQNRLSDRLSPIGGVGNAFANGGGHGSGLAHTMTNHRSPVDAIGEQVSSPPYYNNSINNHLSPQGTLQTGDDHLGYSPYSWNSKNLNGGGVNPHDSQGYLDTNKSRGMDSDETDSIDSGNGSSGSSSGRHNNDDAGYNGVNNNHKDKGASVNSKSSTNRGTELTGSQSANFVTSASCNRVSSTTNGSGSGYHTSPQSSPESQIEQQQNLQQQKSGCVVKVKQANGPASGGSGRNGSANSSAVVNGHARTVSKDREREKEPRSDRERTGRDRESRGRDRDRERSDKRGHRDRKPAHAGVPMEISRDRQNNNENGDNTQSTKPTAPQYPPYLTKYAPIESEEQRSRYKDDFNTEYPLYRDLHAVIEKVSKKFAQLEERLRSEKRGSEEYQMVRDQIVKEYYSSKKDKKYQEAKEKFNYLHQKLSHIKSLVSEFDHRGGDISSPVR